MVFDGPLFNISQLHLNNVMKWRLMRCEGHFHKHRILVPDQLWEHKWGLQCIQSRNFNESQNSLNPVVEWLYAQLFLLTLFCTVIFFYFIKLWKNLNLFVGMHYFSKLSFAGCMQITCKGWESQLRYCKKKNHSGLVFHCICFFSRYIYIGPAKIWFHFIAWNSVV